VVDGAPAPFVTGAIATLGAANRPLLAFGTVVIALLIGAAAAVVGRDRPWLTGAVFAGCRGPRPRRAWRSPGADAVPVVVVMAVAALVGHTVLRRALPASGAGVGHPRAGHGGHRPGSPSRPARHVVAPAFLRLAVGTGAAVLVVGAAGRWWLGGGRVDPASIALPTPARSLPPPGPDLATRVAGSVRR
jgi:hypothetical protein